ncbi:hypothetical protein IW261DRAFT_1569897 [Armillaria novae-zelandiae]|uniref:Uncharacterized protein n=1 Tax=Armillaria novae-zelandiae TaxID=153914 RepID=A0AA39NXZ6_9AGAR|nr:hypothetical protein IW261DRAFT_1569897 [Armillaria novae-zelandiae]
MTAGVRRAWFEPVGKRKCCNLAIPCAACAVILYGEVESPSLSPTTVGSPASTPVIGDTVASSSSLTIAAVPPVPHASAPFMGAPSLPPLPPPCHPAPPSPLGLPVPLPPRQRLAPLDVAAIGYLLEHSMAMLAKDLGPFIDSYQAAPVYTASGPRMRGDMERVDRTLRLFRRLVELVDESFVEQWDIDLMPDEHMPRWKRHITSYETVARLM